jgi:peroxiredoxin
MKHNAIFFLICLLTLGAASPGKLNYGIGDKVSDFTLKNVDGKMVSLSGYNESKGVIVIFDCNTCPYSKAYNDRIIALNHRYASQGFPVVTINSNSREISSGDSFEEMVAQAKRKNYTFPYLADQTQRVARLFGATNTPHAFVLQREGEDFEVAYIGAIDNNARNASAADKKYVEEAVNALLAGQPVPTPKTKAVGCGIQWANG